MFMDQKRSFSLPIFLFYACFLFSSFAFFYIGNNGEPFALSLLFSALSAGFSPTVCCILYIISAFSGFSFRLFPSYIAQALLLFIAFFIRNKTQEKHAVYPFMGLFLALSVFVFFAPFTAYALPSALSFAAQPLVQKAIVAGGIFLLSASFSVALKAISRKLLKCRLKTDELIFSVLLCVVLGIGICRAASVTAYMGIAFFVLLLFSCATKDASVPVCAFILSLPPFFCAGVSLERFFLYGIALAFASKIGRLPSVLALLGVFFLYGFTDGLLTLRSDFLLGEILSVLIPSLLFLFLPSSVLEKAQNKLIFYREKHLPRIAINRNRAGIGEQLFEISGVFREIQATFTSLSDGDSDKCAKEYICTTVYETVCKRCPNHPVCIKKGLKTGLSKLVEVGVIKGRVSLIDVPKELADICSDQSGVLYALGSQLNEYRKHTLEAENAKDGRALLAKQAQGVSEILKNLALEQSAPLSFRTEKEKKLDVDLLKAGVVCSEILLSGEDETPTLSLITYGKADVKKIAAVASLSLGIPLIISERFTLGKDKFCCILRKKPVFDAAFGVITKRKTGETASGDTHSVIKIDERRFMLALSDGMGSGEYARKISESTVSLLESFYRAKMPSPLVLSTVNKLLTFSKEESFACVDVASVDLDTGIADVVKIGSPMGFILSENSLKILDGGALPLGILDSIRPDAKSYELKENDVLLFLSDGITGAFPSSADLYEALKRIPVINPQELVESLAQQALSLYGGVAKDDMTALAVRLFKAV